jgi:diadenylate cyclase
VTRLGSIVAALTSFNLARAAVAVVDVSIVAYVVYRLLLFIRGTRAVQLLKGIVVLFVVAALAQVLHLDATYWLFEKAEVALLIALPIIFQPELRRALEQVGRGRFFAARLPDLGPAGVANLLDELLRAAGILSRNKVGALIVIERSTGLSDVAENGIAIDGIVSAEFLVNIFIPNTPLHDGAVIVRGNRVLAAACFLPLAEAVPLGSDYGSRHRAAVGVTEHSDAVALVVSEETGHVSLANAGKLIRHLDEQTLREMLENLLPEQEASPLLHLWWTRAHPPSRPAPGPPPRPAEARDREPEQGDVEHGPREREHSRG